MSYRFGSVQVSKLQLACILGAPLAVGLGYYVYARASGKSLDDQGKSKRTTQQAKSNLQNKSLSIDGNTVDKDLEQKKKLSELESTPLSPLKEATIYKNEGNNYYKMGKFDEAIKLYDKAIDKCPQENKADLSIFYQNRAAAYEMLQRWSKVKEDCTKSIACNTRYTKAYFRRAKALEATNDLEECLNDLTTVCFLEMFQNQSSLSFADRILKQLGMQAGEKTLEQHVPVLPSGVFIDTYMRTFATDPLQEPIEPKPTPEQCQRGYLRARAALEAKQFEDIIPACTEELETSEAESQYKTEALLMRATFHGLSSSFELALKDLEAIINNPDVEPKFRCYALLKRASINIQTDKKDQGMEDFKAAEQLLPECPDVYHQRAQVYIIYEQLTEAMQDFEQVLKYAPDHSMAHLQKCYSEYRHAILSQDQMQLMRVMNSFKNAVERFPDCVESYSLMAQVLTEQQQFEQADKFYEKALKVAPDNAALLVHRALMYLQWHCDLPKAVQLMEQAIEVDEKCELAYESLATLEVQRTNLTRAVELLNKAILLAKSKAELAHLHGIKYAALAQKVAVDRLGGINPLKEMGNAFNWVQQPTN